MPIVTAIVCKDIRFPTSLEQHGSDAMHTDPDYSAAYVEVQTDTCFSGYGIAFTLGRGTEVVLSAVAALKHLVVGKDVYSVFNDFGSFWRQLTQEPQLRWLGPQKGVTHMATAAIINALWDLWAKMENKPLWKLLVDLEPERLVACIDFTYITDVITPQQAIELLRSQQDSKAERETYLDAHGYPAYITSAGWMGYTDDKIRELCRAALKEGWTSFKMKVGARLEDDIKRSEIIREEIGYDCKLMMDANQRWDVDEAIAHMKQLLHVKPHWIEEPTSPDDILGHARIAAELRPYGVAVATGEHCQNRVVFKQLMQAGALNYCQIDCCRVAGVNENLAIILMAAKLGVPVVPHAGGVGLCEMVQHLSFFDYICVTGSLENRMIEYVDHLHEHFVNPVHVTNARYMLPKALGHCSEMKAQSVIDFSYPDGVVWRNMAERKHDQRGK